MIVHIQTTVQTVFGITDEDGNVKQVPLSIQVPLFKQELFNQVYQELSAQKTKLEQENGDK